MVLLVDTGIMDAESEDATRVMTKMAGWVGVGDITTLQKQVHLLRYEGSIDFLDWTSEMS